jgi:hypothetical protein
MRLLQSRGHPHAQENAVFALRMKGTMWMLTPSNKLLYMIEGAHRISSGSMSIAPKTCADEILYAIATAA